jgi:hypothetical protein
MGRQKGCRAQAPQGPSQLSRDRHRPSGVTGDPVLLQISKGRHKTLGSLQIVRCRRRTRWGATTGFRSLYRSPGAARGLQDHHRPFNASIRHHGHRKSPVTTINVQESVITVLKCYCSYTSEKRAKALQKIKGQTSLALKLFNAIWAHR